MNIVYIPNGTKNLKQLFPTLNWRNVAEYSTQVVSSSGAVMSTAPSMVVDLCEDNDDLRIHFINYLGAVDALSFKLIAKEHENKSDQYRKGITIPLDHSVHNISRINIESNDVYTATLNVTDENTLNYYDELFDTPVAWLEWAGTQGQPAGYIPIVMLDKKSTKFKSEDRYNYEIQVEFKLSHDKIILRP